MSTYEVYPNGISTSLPFDVQLEILHSIVGLENCSVTRPGYAIEYDFFDPRGLNKNLSCKGVDGLFFAGQINGTTGYEEAAAQGILAGINAACYVQEKPSLELSRSDAYLGVLVDDLASLGTSEPYRMFTSRAEYRLALREDNADKRLSEKAYGLGLLSTDQHNQMIAKYAQVDATMEALEATSISLTNKNRPLIEAQGFAVSKDETAASLLKRPDFSYNHLVACGLAEPLTSDVQEIVETECRYSGYLARQEKEILMAQSKENTKIPIDFDYAKIPSLSKEIQEKLKLHHPETLGLASRISGVTPAAVSILGIFLHKKKAA